MLRRIDVKALAICFWVLTLLAIMVGISMYRRHRVRPTPGMEAPVDDWIRVLLMSDVESCTFEADGGIRATDLQSGSSLMLEEATELELLAGRLVFGSAMFGTALLITADEPHIFEVDGERLRGNAHVRVQADGTGMEVVNHVPVEAYLAGVVGAEMPSGWEMEALKAQAVASRTYALFIKQRFGTGRSWDVRRTQANQVYKGLSGESRRIWQAVNETMGEILFFQSNDGLDIFPTYFSSCCGGHTENSEYVFGDSYPTLQGVRCPYCRETARSQLFQWEPVAYTENTVYQRLLERYPNLSAIGSIQKVEVQKEHAYEDFSRILSVRIVGEEGKHDMIRGEDFRLSVDSTGRRIKSSACHLKHKDNKYIFEEGRGFGHGVGLCQYGAQAMARRGKTKEDILLFYYPTAAIGEL